MFLYEVEDADDEHHCGSSESPKQVKGAVCVVLQPLLDTLPVTYY